MPHSVQSIILMPVGVLSISYLTRVKVSDKLMEFVDVFERVSTFELAHHHVRVDVCEQFVFHLFACEPVECDRRAFSC